MGQVDAGCGLSPMLLTWVEEAPSLSGTCLSVCLSPGSDTMGCTALQSVTALCACYGLWQSKVEGKRKWVWTTELWPTTWRHCWEEKKTTLLLHYVLVFLVLWTKDLFSFLRAFLFQPKRLGKAGEFSLLKAEKIEEAQLLSPSALCLFHRSQDYPELQSKWKEDKTTAWSGASTLAVGCV